VLESLRSGALRSFFADSSENGTSAANDGGGSAKDEGSAVLEKLENAKKKRRWNRIALK
jgi:hypothetical protein